uniref:Uncharacterized protein n=1 Tax=viral metagenome TaxID=1070528 RepID=A0A6M3XUZ4_9ZZZZ
MLVINDILRKRRQYFIEKVKAPLLRAIHILAKKYPEPTQENLVFNNSKILLGIKEDIKKYLHTRGDLIDDGLKVLVDEVEHDGFYEFLFDYLIIELLKRGWQPEHRGFPMYRHWTGPLYTDNWTETDADWLLKRRQELIKQADENLAKIQKKIDDGELWYFNLDKLTQVINAGR